jgi:hypothetical protein
MLRTCLRFAAFSHVQTGIEPCDVGWAILLFKVGSKKWQVFSIMSLLENRSHVFVASLTMLI